MDATRQRLWGALVPALGLLALYPVSVGLLIWFRPSIVLSALLLGILARFIQFWMTERPTFFSRLRTVLIQAAFVSGIGILFWLPGVLGSNVGMFSEAGGDFTIYAGLPAKVGDAPLWHPHLYREMLHAAAKRRLWDVSATISDASEPPAPGWSLRRIVDLQWAEKFTGWFTLQHLLSPLQIAGVGERYLALLATLWGLLAAVIYQTVRLRGGKVAGGVALTLAVVSQNLAAVGYNHYYPELLSSTLLISLLAIFMIPRLAALSRASLWTLMIVSAMSVTMAYYPILPALLVPFLFLVLYCRDPLEEGGLAVSGRRMWVCCATVIGAALLLALPFFAQLRSATGLLKIAHPASAHDAADLTSALAPPQPYGLDQIASFFGAFSLHRLAPYSST
ncbi:MAG: hypothetical protein M3N19_08735, partial [Candidatus Eremiobacteraeota bacterium]|nr:hypothetical protein [Candidatus Eremiobacteraeota bacterium]